MNERCDECGLDHATVSPVHGAAAVRAPAEDNPSLPSPDPDEAARAGGYGDLGPKVVAEEVAADAERLARKVDGMSAADWSRRASFRHEEVDAVRGR